jgi:hypothetical protein
MAKQNFIQKNKNLLIAAGIIFVAVAYTKGWLTKLVSMFKK